MKRCAALFLSIFCVLTLAACTGAPAWDGTANALRPLEEAAQTYTLEEAKKEGCFVLKNGVVASGLDAFLLFLSRAEAGEPAFLRIVTYAAPDHGGHGLDLCASRGVSNASLSVADLSFAETLYTVSFYQDGSLVSRQYPHLITDDFSAPALFPSLSGGTAYFLCDKKDASFWEVFSGIPDPGGGTVSFYPIYVSYYNREVRL